MSANSRDTADPQTGTKKHSLNRRNILLGGTTLAAASALTGSPTPLVQTQAQPAPSGQRPNIIVIMEDDIGWFNIGAYHRGVMAGRTPNLDRTPCLFARPCST